MAAPRINKAQKEVLDAFGFEFSAPPAKNTHRKSRYHERWLAAREICQAYPGESLKVMEYGNAGSASTTAKNINNGEHEVFTHDSGNWTATARKFSKWVDDEDYEDGGYETDAYGVWLSYTPAESES